MLPCRRPSQNAGCDWLDLSDAGEDKIKTKRLKQGIRPHVRKTSVKPYKRIESKITTLKKAPRPCKKTPQTPLPSALGERCRQWYRQLRPKFETMRDAEERSEREREREGRS